MPLLRKIAATLATALLPVAAVAATLGGADYATQYDFSEFFQATDGKPFQVIVAGDPFPGLAPDVVAPTLLAQMQANKPRPRLTFTYAPPPERPRPYYRLVLVFNAANDLGAGPVCANGETRLKPGIPGRVHVFAVYCRNELALSQLTGWTNASGPDDPRVGELFKDVFAQLFSDAMHLRPQNANPSFR